MTKLKLFSLFLFIIIPVLATGCQKDITNIERPEKIVSKRQIVYDKDTYSKLADLWEAYNNEFPSEDSYANWMYAARYAGWPNYESLLEKGSNKYPANPTLLYLSALLKHGAKNNLEAVHLLERATKLDPSFLDPWFALAVDYMSNGDLEKSDAALRKLLEGKAINDEIMDYNYNVITLLDKNAILITNGDNDTYPGWIITRILKYRPDVKIVNRSLLNSDWYPIHLMKNDGIPNFITQENLTNLRSDILTHLKEDKMKTPIMGPFSDTLLTYLINTAKVKKRPVYLAATLYSSEVINTYKENGVNLGLVTQIEPIGKKYSVQIKTLIDKWLTEFRTGGLSSWRLRYGKESSAGRWLIMNYAGALKSLMNEIIENVPEKRLDLFRWYQKYILDLIPVEKVDNLNSIWCRSIDIKEIKQWCISNNYIE